MWRAVQISRSTNAAASNAARRNALQRAEPFRLTVVNTELNLPGCHKGSTLFTGIAVLGLVPLLSPPAAAKTIDQIKAECRQQFTGPGANRRADRSGVTVSKAISDCVKAEKKKNKTKK